jgi:hypothetical protein
MFHEAQATDYIDLMVQLEDLAANSHVDTLAINVAGTGWAVGDQFDINGGTVVNGLNARGEVLAEAGGVPSSIRLYNGGAYTVNPGVAATTTAIFPSVGINLTVDTSILVTGWVVDRSDIYDSPERELLMHGLGSGAEAIYCQFQTRRNVGAGVFYWEIQGASGFDNGELFDDQPGSSKQTVDTDDLSTPLNNGIIDYWFVIDPFHIKGIFKSGSSYTNLYTGFINTYVTAAEYPYPLYVSGCSSASSRNIPFNDSSDFMSGMHDPISFSSVQDGPGALREVDGQWYRFRNAFPSGANKNTDSPEQRSIYPCRMMPNSSAVITPQNRFSGSSIVGTRADAWFGGLLAAGGAAQLDPTPDSAGDIQFLWPNVLYQQIPSLQILGELIDVYPVVVRGIGAVSEDTMTDANGNTYILFQNCNRTDTWAFFAIKRNF